MLPKTNATINIKNIDAYITYSTEIETAGYYSGMFDPRYGVFGNTIVLIDSPFASPMSADCTKEVGYCNYTTVIANERIVGNGVPLTQDKFAGASIWIPKTHLLLAPSSNYPSGRKVTQISTAFSGQMMRNSYIRLYDQNSALITTITFNNDSTWSMYDNSWVKIFPWLAEVYSETQLVEHAQSDYSYYPEFISALSEMTYGAVKVDLRQSVFAPNRRTYPWNYGHLTDSYDRVSTMFGYLPFLSEDEYKAAVSASYTWSQGVINTIDSYSE